MKILVTGSAGFIGSHLVPCLYEDGRHETYLCDRATVPDHDLLRPGVALEQARLVQPDVIVHLAAQVGRLFGEDNVHYTVNENAVMTTLVAQAAAAVDARLVYASTSEVYGDQGEGLCEEGGVMTLPHNLYGLSKRWGEEVAYLYATAGLQIIRLSMPFGPGLPAGRGRAAIVNMLDQAARGVEIPVHRDAKRCWCWIGDTVRGMRLVIEEGEISTGLPGSGFGEYNIGRDDNELTMHSVACLAREIADPLRRSQIRVVEPPANQTVVKRLSSAKIRRLGWAPEVDVVEGMQRTWQAMKEEHREYAGAGYHNRGDG